MADSISLDQLCTQATFDLVKLQEHIDPNNLADGNNLVDDSPFTLMNNECTYYEPSEVKTLIPNDNKSLNLFCLNCQGLRSHWDLFCNLLVDTCGDKHHFDVIGITELYSMADGECQLSGYHELEYKVRSKTADSRGGVGIFIKNDLQYILRTDLSIFIPNIFESIFIEIQWNKKSLLIGTVYRPNTPPKADIDIFNHSLYELQNHINIDNKQSIIMGDMNLDLLKFADHNKTNDYLEQNFSQGFIPMITKPTRITPHSATLIDHMFTNIKGITANSGILITDLSDHFGIFSIIISKHKQQNQSLTHTFRSFTPTNLERFNNLLKEADFTNVLEVNCPNIAYNNFMEIYTYYLDEIMPLKSRKLQRKYTKRSPWFTTGLLQSSLTKSKLFNKKLKYPNDINIARYKNYCKIYNKLLRHVKQTYYADQLEQAKHDVKKTWNILRQALNSSSSKPKIPDYFIYENSKVEDKEQIVNHFNNFFSNIGKEISNQVPLSPKHYSDYLNPKHNRSIFIDPISPLDILSITSKIKSKNSQGHDGISTKLMKGTINSIIDPITHIMNKSIETGLVPEQMKIAKITPIFKSGSMHSFNNYRPISILPAFSKILEKVIANKLIKFLENQNLLYKHQYGFRPHHSTTHPIIHLLKQIAEENDKDTKDLTLSVFIDLSKAFDTISHDILLTKLDNLGIRGIANLWFKNYLSNRKQYLELYKKKSLYANIICGVPQGSILGPILFLIYVNDICNATRLNVLSFADDTTVSKSSSDIRELYQITNLELQNLTEWFNSNRLCLNVKKTKYILFSPSNVQKLNNCNIYINNQIVDRIGNNEFEKSFKFLGIHMDEKLSWKFHIDKIANKIARANYILSKVKNILSNNTLKTLYTSLVHSHIDYGLTIWGNSNHIDRLFKLQKKSLRIINKKPYNSHTEPLFKNCGIMQIYDQYKYNILKFMYQLKYQKLPISFHSFPYFTQLDRRHTRQYQLAHCLRYRTTYSSKLPLHTFPRIWNILDIDLQQSKSINVFKKNVKQQILNNYTNEVFCTNPRCKQCFPE